MPPRRAAMPERRTPARPLAATSERRASLARHLLAMPERLARIPAKHLVPVLIGGLALQVAVVGMYWDIGYHIDHGRDEGMLTLPHLLIVVGLQGIVVAALVHGALPGPAARGERRLPMLGWRFAPGGIVMLVCGGIALLGFPLDAVWHALFGEDVTLWGPTHLFMIGGAGVSTLGLWMLMRQGMEHGRPTRLAHRGHVRVAGALLIGLSTFQAEFDFGVPQFQLLYQPVLIAFAAAVALVAARSLLGPWGAFKALVMFLVVRGALALFVGPVAGYTTPHFPLYIAEAAVVEAAALVAWRSPLRFALLGGAGIGTVGLAAEWAWSHVWMPHPWTSSMLPEAVVVTLAAAVAGAVLGVRLGQSLALPGSARAALAPLRPAAVGAAAVVALAALLAPLPRSGGDGTRAAIVPTSAAPGEVRLSVRLDPARAARRAEWFEVISWQGRTRGDLRRLTQLHEVAPGRYVTEGTVPVSGNWKSILRLAKGSHLMGLPVYLPASPESGRPAVAPRPRSGAMRADTFLLQREATGGSAWLETTAYAVLAAVVAVWLALLAWALLLAEPRRGPRSATAATVPSPWAPPSAPA
jgi:hypothetical protein